MQLRLKPVSLFLALGIATTVAACGPEEVETTEPELEEGTEEVVPAEGVEEPLEEEPLEEGGEGGEG